MRHNTVPKGLIAEARVVDMPDVRAWGDEYSTVLQRGLGDLYRIYTVAQRDGIEFNLAYIPDDYDIGAQESFDQEAMKRLFQLGYEWARAGYPWQKLPPGLEEQSPGTR